MHVQYRPVCNSTTDCVCKMSPSHWERYHTGKKPLTPPLHTKVPPDLQFMCASHPPILVGVTIGFGLWWLWSLNNGWELTWPVGGWSQQPAVMAQHNNNTHTYATTDRDSSIAYNIREGKKLRCKVRPLLVCWCARCAPETHVNNFESLRFCDMVRWEAVCTAGRHGKRCIHVYVYILHVYIF